jgi:hypothetical protein
MSFNLYSNLLAEIEMLEIRISDMEIEREYLRKSMYANAPQFKGVVDYAKEYVTGGLMPLPLDKIIERLNKIDDSLNVLYQLLTEKKTSKERINIMLASLEGIDNKVVYMRDIKGMRLKEIAVELGYSLDRIKQISCRNPRRKHYTFTTPSA